MPMLVSRLRGCRRRRRRTRASTLLEAVSRRCGVRTCARGSSRCEITKIVVVVISHSQEIRWRRSGSEGTNTDGSPHARGGGLSPPAQAAEITPARRPRGWRCKASSTSIAAGKIIPHGSKRIDLARTRQRAVEAHGPLHLAQPRHLGCSRRPWGLGAVDEAEEVIEVGGGCAVLVGMGGGPDEGDIVER